MTKVQCMMCGEILESRHVHDYKTCKCGLTMLDGGNDYIRTTVYAKILKEDFVSQQN